MQIVLDTNNLAEAERILILVALAEMGDLAGAAELCGVALTRLRRLMSKHAIEWPGVPLRPRKPRAS